jgi:hypothetical protein
MNPSLIDSPSQSASQGINFLGQVPLADASYGRITAHLAKRL